MQIIVILINVLWQLLKPVDSCDRQLRTSGRTGIKSFS